MAKYGSPLSLDGTIQVDLIVVGSVAVDPQTGCRLGKGEGFAELEYGMLRRMGAVDGGTLVATTVRDEQVVPPGAIPAAAMLPHDVPVDIIVTPTQVCGLGLGPPAGGRGRRGSLGRGPHAPHRMSSARLFASAWLL